METSERLIDIESAVLELRTKDEVHRFLDAILTRAEYGKIRQRWQVYQLRAQGMPLDQIVSTTKIAIGTASRSAAIRRSSHNRILDTIITRAGVEPVYPK
jgi:uncharacterized protein YerC